MDREADDKLVEQFKAMLEEPAPKGKKKELVIQDFLERHPQFIPTPNLLNHRLHLDAILSQFPIDTSITSDYVYLTKSSDRWRITLVELEIPDKQLFNDSGKGITVSAEFNAAIGQIREWQVFVRNHESEIKRRLHPLLVPPGASENPIEFCYQLIIGRSAEKQAHRQRKEHLHELRKQTGIDIMTYDTLLGYYAQGPREMKNILRLTGEKFAFKHLHIPPQLLFAYLGPAQFQLRMADKDVLRKDGYEIDKWEKGELLTYNMKYARSSEKPLDFSLLKAAKNPRKASS